MVDYGLGYLTPILYFYAKFNLSIFSFVFLARLSFSALNRHDNNNFLL
jgi:hypothetical protein